METRKYSSGKKAALTNKVDFYFTLVVYLTLRYDRWIVYSTLLITLIIAIFGIVINVRFRKAKIVRNFFQKVLILLQKAPKLVRFKKDLGPVHTKTICKRKR